MRIKDIYVSEYKNLKDFTLNFDGESFIDVFVGKNGTGKSNLFEAILEIFKHLFEEDYEVSFDFKLRYELEGNVIFVSWKWTEGIWLDEKGAKTKKLSEKQLPDNILIYYSGHNDKITELVETYENKFKSSLKEANEGDTRKFISIGKEYKALLLSVLLLQPKECKAKLFIENKLGIKTIDNQVKITLKRPFYAKKKGYDIDSVQSETKFWKAKGITQSFLNKLETVKKGELIVKDRLRDEGYLYREDFEDEYIMYLDIEDFQNKFSDSSAQDVFREFDNLKTIEMLSDITIQLELFDGTKIGVDKFSDGQFQSVYIYSIIELFKDRNCISLLDEPDAFLHPEWQFSFLKQVFEITDQNAVNNHVLMTSHSASTITTSKEKTINLFEINGNTITVVKHPKSDIIKSLSSGLITFSETEAKLNINHFLNNTSAAVLFTEGITDEMILETAWNKLYPEEKPNFEIQNAFDRIFLRNLFSRDEIKANYPGRKFFALFDFDEAYDDWNGLTKKAEEIITNPFLGLTRQISGHEIYAMLLPVPNIDTIKRQVLKPDDTPWGKGSASHLSIELLFYDNNPENLNYSLENISGGGQLLQFSGDKANFAKNVVPKLPVEAFEIFRPMFEFIKEKIK